MRKEKRFSGQFLPVKISFTESIVILECSSIALDPISDKRLYTLYRTVALLYIKLYNTMQPDLASRYLSATFEGILYVTASVGCEVLDQTHSPGPFAPPLSNLPSLKMTALSYS